MVGWFEARVPGQAPRSHAFLWSNGRMRDLGTLALDGGGDRPSSSGASAIDERGVVIGTSQVNATGPRPHAFRWFAGVMQDLGCGRVPPARCDVRGDARALNERGQIVGHLGDVPESVTRPLRAFLWQPGAIRRLGPLPGRTASTASDINERGQIVGTSYVIRGDYYHLKVRAFLWQSGRLRDLGALPGDTESEAVAINDAGQVIGLSYGDRTESGGGRVRGFVWQNGKMRDLGALEPTAISNRGQIVGFTGSELEGTEQAFVWHAGQTTMLGPFVRWSGIAVNDRGQVAGSRSFADGKIRAAVWQDGQLFDLGTLPGGRESSAYAINERGQVVGSSRTRHGKHRAVLWTRRGGLYEGPGPGPENAAMRAAHRLRRRSRRRPLSRSGSRVHSDLTSCSR